MKRLLKLLKYLLNDFGPLITYYIVDQFFGLRVALVCSLVVTIIEVVNLKLRKKEQLSGFFKFSVSMTFAFGVLDIFLAKAVFIRYEAALMNFCFGAYFASTLLGQSPIMIEFAQKSGKFDRELTPELVSFFRYLTMIWVCYFLAKAGFYVWKAHQDWSLAELLLVRLIVGSGSLGAMILLSAFGSRALFKILDKFGMLTSKTMHS